MNRKVSYYVIAVLVLALIMSACTPTIDTNQDEELAKKDKLIASLEGEKQALEEKIAQLEEENFISEQIGLISTALQVAQAIKDEDMVELSTFIHPTDGVRFSPYGYIDVQTSQVFTGAQISGLMSDSQVYSWGNYDGTGDSIDLTFTDYFEEFVYDEDYLEPHIIGNNVLIGKGNTLNNISNVYPNGEFVEFHFTGFDPQYEGIDWSSLRLVFEEDNGTWYLVGIVHDQWTI